MNEPLSTRPTLSERIAAYVHGADLKTIEPLAVQRAKEVILYNVALALQCRRDEHPLGVQAVSIARDLSLQGGPATLIGYRERAMPLDAAFANCSQMRAYTLDDVIFPAGIHSGLMAIPGALALAEERGRSGRDVVVAVIVAYEVMGKLGTFAWDTQTPRRPTMAYGTFGATIAAGRVLGLTREQFRHAIGYAAHSAQGVAEAGDLPGPPEHYYSLLTRAGMTGALVAEAGGRASSTALEGRFGFFDTFVGPQPVDADKLIASLGHDYQIVDWVEKRYPGTGLNVVGVELLREIVTSQKLRSDDVREVRFIIPQERRNFEAGHATGPFTSAEEAKGNAVCHMAMLLVDGKLDFRRYEQFDAPEMRAAIAKIKPVLVPGKSNIRWTRIEVDVKDGRTIAREGETHSFPPISAHERLADAAEGLLSPAKIERAVELFMKLEEQPSIAPLMACLVPDAA
ncbi:MAG TPA: MmgE/PrpD family protein [Steroidobacter sp.]